MKKIFFTIIVVLFIIFVYFLNKADDKNKIIEDKKDYYNMILDFKNEDISIKLLDYIKENYSINTLKSIYQILNEDKYNREIWYDLTGKSYIVLNDLMNNKYKNAKNVKIIDNNKETISLSFAGDVSLADNWEIMPYYKSRNKKVYGILSEDTIKYMQDTDVMVVNSEFCFSTRGTPLKNKMYTFRAHPKNVSIYDEMGVDLVTLANNHVYDYGAVAFSDTLKTLKDANIPYIGAGENINEAKQAYYFIINGKKFAFVNATRAEKYILTPEAKENSSGVFRAYNPKEFQKQIKLEKTRSDYVVALIHWGREDTHELENVQLETGKLYIDSGADIVIGTHAHVLQGMEVYNNKLIAYNLGDFIFSKGTKDTGILTWTIDKKNNSSYIFIPGIQKNNKTSLVYNDDALKVYNKLEKYSTNININQNGMITLK